MVATTIFSIERKMGRVDEGRWGGWKKKKRVVGDKKGGGALVVVVVWIEWGSRGLDVLIGTVQYGSIQHSIHGTHSDYNNTTMTIIIITLL